MTRWFTVRSPLHVRPRTVGPETTPAVLPAVVESRGAVAPVGRPAAPHPLLTKHDPWADNDHGGSANLDEHPGSFTELHYAGRVFHGELAARRHLVSVARSPERADALVRYVRRLALAQGVLSRAAGGAA